MLSIMFKNGGARLFIEKDLTAEVLAENIAKLIQNPELLFGNGEGHARSGISNGSRAYSR